LDFKDYYATLGVARTASQDEVKRAYRKLARKFHPDVSKEPNAEARFKEVAEAHEALIDPERRAAYDDMALRQQSGQAYEPPFGGQGRGSNSGAGFEYSGRGDPGMSQGPNGENFSDFFESLFGRARSSGGGKRARRSTAGMPIQGEDHHAKVLIDLQDSYRGAERTVSLRMPVMDDSGQLVMQERQLEVNIPKGVRQGQHLRLVGQGAQGHGGAGETAHAGDLYLEIQFRPDPLFRVDERDVYFDLPVSPWEAALGGTVTAPTPDGPVELTVPPGSTQGRKLRLKGKGLPGKDPGDLYAVLMLSLPAAGTQSEKDAYTALSQAFAHYNPRSAFKA
jgi:curved DNA-binding protein